jgi:hypothetical protein
MTRRLALGLLLTLLGSVGRAAPAAPQAPLKTLAEKPFGLLVLGAGGDRDWKTAVDAMSKKFSRDLPFDFAEGEADVQAIQKAVDRLQAARVKKLVVVPLYPTSNSPLMDETRFIFGIREDPSPEFFRAGHASAGYAMVRRAQIKLPVVLTQALDDNPLVVEVLTSRALALSRHAPDEAVILVGLAPASAPAEGNLLRRSAQTPAAKPDSSEDEYRQTLAALAERVRAKGGFKSGGAAVLEPDALHQSDRQHHEDELRKQVWELSRSQRILIVPHALTGEVSSRIIARALQGTFVRRSEKGLLPDDRIVRWVDETARQAAGLPDMRAFKDAGRPLPSEGQSKPTRLKLQGNLQ